MLILKIHSAFFTLTLTSPIKEEGTSEKSYAPCCPTHISCRERLMTFRLFQTIPYSLCLCAFLTLLPNFLLFPLPSSI